MDYKALADQLVKTCPKQGADAAEVYLQAGARLTSRSGTARSRRSRRRHHRAWAFACSSRGAWRSASCNDLTRRLARRARSAAPIEFARSTTADPNNVLPTDKGVTAVEGLYDPAHREGVDGAEDRAGHSPRIARDEESAHHQERRRRATARARARSSSPTRTASRRAYTLVVLLAWRVASSPRRASRSRRAGIRARAGSSPISGTPEKSRRGPPARASSCWTRAWSRPSGRPSSSSPMSPASIPGRHLAARERRDACSRERASWARCSTRRSRSDAGDADRRWHARRRASASAPFDGEGVPTQKADHRREGRAEGIPLQHRRRQAAPASRARATRRAAGSQRCRASGRTTSS